MNDIQRDEEDHKPGSKMVLYAKKLGSTILGGNLLFIFLIHRYSSWFRQNIIFAHALHWPRILNFDLSKPETFDMKGTRNFYLQSEKNVKIGVWLVLPVSSVITQSGSQESFEDSFGDGKPIIVYAHGNSGDRGSSHRIDLYKKLQDHDYHVVAFDYRGYGDSSQVSPDEVGVVEDTITVIMWVLEHKRSSQVFIWGHSLGTGISARSLKVLEERGVFVDGLILEAPFNNLRDELRNHPLGLPLKHMVGFDYLFVKPFHESGISFRSDEYLSQCRVPILIVHAENDWIVPTSLGRRLYDYVRKNRKDGAQNVKYVQLGDNYGHKWICTCPSLMTLIKLFIEKKYGDIPVKLD